MRTLPLGPSVELHRPQRPSHPDIWSPHGRGTRILFCIPLTHFPVPIGSSTEGPSGRVRMRYPHSFLHPPHTFQPSPALPRRRTYSRILVAEYGWVLRQANCLLCFVFAFWFCLVLCVWPAIAERAAVGEANHTRSHTHINKYIYMYIYTYTYTNDYTIGMRRLVNVIVIVIVIVIVVAIATVIAIAGCEGE